MLPDSEAQALVARIHAENTETADRTLRDLAADWGDAWPSLLDDLKRHGLSPAHAELAAMENLVSRQTFVDVLATQANEPGALRAEVALEADYLDDLVHRYRASDDGLFLTDDRTKLVKLLAYHYAQMTEPEEAVRHALSDITGDIIPTLGSDEKSEADDIADVYRGAGQKLRGNRPAGDGSSIFHYIVDLEKGAVRGARKGIQNAIDLLAESGNDLNQYVLDKTGIDLTIDSDFKWPVLPDTPAPQTAGGEAAQWVGQFLVGFGPIVKALRFARGGAPTTSLGTFAEMEAAAAGASAIALDPLEKRLANFWNEHGLSQNILTDFLEAKPGDTRPEGALKNAIESLGLGAVVGGGFFLGAKLLRALKGAEKIERKLAEPEAGEQFQVASRTAETPVIVAKDSSAKALPKALQGNERYAVEDGIEYVRFTTGLDAGAIDDAVASAEVRAGLSPAPVHHPLR